MNRWTLAILAFASTLVCGCGTFSDAFCGPITDDVYFRGVRLDLMCIREGGAHSLMAADLPFSAAADTVLIPYLFYHQVANPPPTRSMTQPKTPSITDRYPE